MVKTKSTEDRIVHAARTIFIRKGMDGARMQEIADEAGINKALLHYYFRTKNKLFEKVFSLVFKDVFQVMEQGINEDMEFESFLENFIRRYIKLLQDKPYIPQFVIHELNRNPERIVEQMQGSAFDKQKLFGLIRQAEERGLIRPISPLHLITNVLALCIFPFVARPIIKGFLLDGDQQSYMAYISERPDEVTAFVRHALMINEKEES